MHFLPPRSRRARGLAPRALEAISYPAIMKFFRVLSYQMVGPDREKLTHPASQVGNEVRGYQADLYRGVARLDEACRYKSRVCESARPTASGKSLADPSRLFGAAIIRPHREPPFIGHQEFSPCVCPLLRAIISILRRHLFAPRA